MIWCQRLSVLMVSAALLCATAAPALRVLSIGAATSTQNWHAVEEFSGGLWRVDDVDLPGFGRIMSTQGFQAALDHSEPLLRRVFSTPPDAVIVRSKGVGVVTFLATLGLWSGPTVLVSPITNACDHIDGGSWEAEWLSCVSVLTEHAVGPIAIGLGDSHDEQQIILDEIEGTGVCGKLQRGRGGGGDALDLFELCPTWCLRSFPGTYIIQL